MTHLKNYVIFFKNLPLQTFFFTSHEKKDFMILHSELLALKNDIHFRCHVDLGGQSNLKVQNITQKVIFDLNIKQFFYVFLRFEIVIFLELIFLALFWLRKHLATPRFKFSTLVYQLLRHVFFKNDHLDSYRNSLLKKMPNILLTSVK